MPVAASVVFDGELDLHLTSGPGLRFETFDIPLDRHQTSPLITLDGRQDVRYAQTAFLTVGGEDVSFMLFAPTRVDDAERPMIRYFILPHVMMPEFTAGDGSVKHAEEVQYHYSPRYRQKYVGGRVVEHVTGGYGAPKRVRARVVTSGWTPSGMSPAREKGQKEFFAGRTMLFTHQPTYVGSTSATSNQLTPAPGFSAFALRVCIHELVHAFGMPHRCGYFDCRSPRSQTCSMNYPEHWMVDADRHLLPGTAGKQHNDTCARHLKEIRRVHLEDNPGLGWE